MKGSSLGETQLCNHLLSDTTVAYVQAGSSIWGDVIMHGAEHFLTHFSMRAPPKPPNPLPSARQAQRTHKHKGPVVTIARFHGNPKQTVSERSNPTPCLETASIIGRLFLKKKNIPSFLSPHMLPLTHEALIHKHNVCRVHMCRETVPRRPCVTILSTRDMKMISMLTG